jgi:hypothetical protein
MSAALQEMERRFRGGLRGVATTEARISTTRAGEDALQRARDNPTLLGVAGVIAAGAVAYGVFAAVNSARQRNQPRSRLAELSERLSVGVESSRRQLERALPLGVMLKLEPESGGYVRVSDARIEPLDKRKRRGQSTVIKKLVWAAFLSVFMAVGAVMARRVADTAWRAIVREDPPTEKNRELPE